MTRILLKRRRRVHAARQVDVEDVAGVPVQPVEVTPKAKPARRSKSRPKKKG